MKTMVKDGKILYFLSEQISTHDIALLQVLYISLSCSVSAHDRLTVSRLAQFD